MTWFRVDDNLAFHAKVVAAGNAAMGLWVRAGAWSAQQLTDGFVPDHMAAALGTPAQAARLVAVRLWTKGEGGYFFHEWAGENRQPTREQVESTRRRAREKKAQQRRNSAGQWAVSPGDSTGTPPGSPEGSPTVPSRPVPTRPTSPNGDVSPAPSPRRKPERPLPADWTPNDGHRTRANDLGLDLDAVAEQFRDHAAANDRRARDWDAAFRTWLSKAAEYAARDRARGDRPLDRQAEILRREMARAVEADARAAALPHQDRLEIGR